MAIAEAAPEVPQPEVYLSHDPASGLHAVIAIDDPRRLPAVGGCRMWPYASQDEAAADALRLARAMSYKSALADLPLGGGKAVIVGDPAGDKSPALLRAFGRFVERLGGRYIGAEDVGISVADLEQIGSQTRHVAGRSRASGSSGDPSPLTARGVLVGIRAALAHRRGSPSLAGVTVGIQGLGHVGRELARLLRAEGASLVVADLDERRLACACRELGARAVEPEALLFEAIDVLAPCALGAVLDAESIPRLHAEIVAGAANNVLASERDGDRLAARGILYAPDYVINAGGIIHIAAELLHRDGGWVDERIEGIAARLDAIFRESDRIGVPPHRIADEQARRKLS